MRKENAFYRKLLIVILAVIAGLGMEIELQDPIASPFIVMMCLIIIGIGFAVDNHLHKSSQ